MSRLKDNILCVGTVGKQSDDSITRLGFSKEYFEAVNIVKKLMEEANLNVTIDKVGNIRGYREGTDKTLKIIMIGSHLDTVKNGGIFDGNLGVMSALECMYMLNEKKMDLKHSIEIVGFNSEEGSELGGTFGSRTIAGLVDIDEKGFEEALNKYNITKNDVLESKVDFNKYKCYLELHIEQGDRLINNKSEIGIVTGIVGLARYKIECLGESNHAGTTMMKNRKDSIVGMSKLIAKIDDLAQKYEEDFVATIGVINAYPNVVNVICGKCEVILELRHMNREVYNAFIEEIINESKCIDNVTFSIEKIIEKESIGCSEELINVIEYVCKEDNVKYDIMPSGASHDANAIAHKVPVGMIFVPSENGISHSKYECTKWQDIEIGKNILFDTIINLDKVQD